MHYLHFCAHEQFGPDDLLRQATDHVLFGTGVTPPGSRYHPTLIAQAWARDDEAALEGARVWKGAQPKEFYKEDRHDSERHVERIREVEELGATTVAPMNNSGADPLAAIGVYGHEVLPKLGVRAAA